MITRKYFRKREWGINMNNYLVHTFKMIILVGEILRIEEEVRRNEW